MVPLSPPGSFDPGVTPASLWFPMWVPAPFTFAFAFAFAFRSAGFSLPPPAAAPSDGASESADPSSFGRFGYRCASEPEPPLPLFGSRSADCESPDAESAGFLADGLPFGSPWDFPAPGSLAAEAFVSAVLGFGLACDGLAAVPPDPAEDAPEGAFEPICAEAEKEQAGTPTTSSRPSGREYFVGMRASFSRSDVELTALFSLWERVVSIRQISAQASSSAPTRAR